MLVTVCTLLLFDTTTLAKSTSGSSVMAAPPEERPMVWNLRFEGNETYRSMILRNQVATEAPTMMRKLRFWNRSGFDLDETELRRDVVRLERFYERRGFYHADISYRIEERRRERRRDVYFDIDEGEPAKVESVSYTWEGGEELENKLRDDRDFGRAMERHSLQSGDRYQLLNHSDVEAYLMESLNEIGYPFARVNVMALLDDEQRNAEVRIHIDPGPLGYIDEILVDGNETISAEKIIRQSNLKEGEIFSQSQLRSAQRHVYGHHLFRFATVAVPEQARDSSVTTRIRVREYPLRSLETRLGAGYEEIIRGSVSWQHRNPWQTGHNLHTRIKASFIEQAVDMDYKFPYIFNANSSITVSPFGQRLDESNYLLLRGGITNSFAYHHSRRLTSTIAYEFTRNTISLVESPETLDSPDITYNISSLQLSSYYGESHPDWGRGWIVRPRAEFSGFLGTGSLEFNRFTLDVRRYINFPIDSQIALRSDSGIIFSGEDEMLPENIRMYSGGTSSVRGWQRRMLGPKRPVFEDDEFDGYVPTGGEAMTSFNIEYRQQMDFMLNNFGMAAFLDGGRVWESSSDVNLREIQVGVGGGLRYSSPIGPIRLDVGYKINPTDEDLNIFDGEDYGTALDRWGFHFSIGQAF